MSEPEPTEVMPTMVPPSSPMVQRCGTLHRHPQGLVALDTGGAVAAEVSPHDHRARGDEQDDAEDDLDACHRRRRQVADQYDPSSAPGTDPSASHFTSPVCTVPRRKWMPPPIGFITTAATRSLEHRGQRLDPEADHQDRRHRARRRPCR